MNCSRCSSPVLEGNRFCGQCGAPVEAAPAPVRAAPRARKAERRQLTVLFYDLVGSTALGARVDPEDFSDALEAFHRRVTSAVTSLGGFVGARVGDGAVVYFGYPQAQEDAAERAVLAALRAVTAGAEVTLPDGSQAAVRIGVATGQGVVSRLSGGESGNEVVGSVANLAARLQGLATPGEVVIADSTRGLVRGLFELEDLGRVEAKGFGAPVQAWRVLGACRGSRFLALHAGEDEPLVGREAQFAQLRAAWREVLDGRSRVVLITGEPGIGKSSLAADFVAQLDGEALFRGNVSFAPHSQQDPLRPFSRRLTIPEGQSAAEALETVLAPGTDAQDAALLAVLLDAPVEPPEAVAGLTAAQRLDRTLDALVGQIRLRSQLGPALMLFEDAHWADPTSLTLLERAVRGEGFERAMLLITARPEFQPDWARAPQVVSVVLPPLGPEDGAALINNVAGADTLPPPLQAAILERADGVPLFLEELTRSTLELMAHAGEAAAQDLPSTLQDSLSARLDRLGPAKEFAQLGAVIGRKFSGQLLSALTDQAPEEQARALDQLLQSGLIVRAGPSEADEYCFRHVLVHETAYGTLLRTDRRHLNARLVAALEAQSPELVAEEPERLAHYAVEAGLFERAAAFWLEAGLKVLLRSAMPEALWRLRQGLAAVAQLPHGSSRWRLELELELALGKAQIATIGYATPATGETFARAKALCDALDDRSRLAAVLHGLWIHDLLCGRLQSAKVRADELLILAEAQGDPVWTVIALRAQGVLGYPLGHFSSARTHLERGLATFDPALRPAYARIVVDDVRVVMAMYLAWVLAYQGEVEAARRLSDDSVTEARSLKHPYTLAHALSGRILTGLFLQDERDLGDLIEELDQLTREHGIRFYGAVCEVLKGRHLVVAGRLEEGARVLEGALQAYRATDSVLYLPTFIMWRADALHRSGRSREGLAAIGEARALMDRTGTCNDAAELRRVEGELRLALGDEAGARTGFEQAAAIAAEQGARLFQRRAEASLAALEPSRGGQAQPAPQPVHAGV